MKALRHALGMLFECSYDGRSVKDRNQEKKKEEPGCVLCTGHGPYILAMGRLKHVFCAKNTKINARR